MRAAHPHHHSSSFRLIINNTYSSHQLAIMGGEQHAIPVSSDYPKLAAGPVGKQINRIYQDRLRQFTDGGQYYGQGLMAYVLVS